MFRVGHNAVVTPLRHSDGRLLTLVKSFDDEGTGENTERVEAPSNRGITESVFLGAVNDHGVFEEHEDIPVGKQRNFDKPARYLHPGKTGDELIEGR